MPDFYELAERYAQALILKSGVREWESEDTLIDLITAARRMAALTLGITEPPPYPWELEQMANNILVPEIAGSPMQIVLASASVNPTAANDLRKGTVNVDHKVFAMSMVSVANGTYRQAVKIDWGAIRAPSYACWACLEWAATPTAGKACSLWIASSSSATAGTGNPGAANGTDAAFTGYSSDAAASVLQMGNAAAVFITVARATTTKQILFGGYYTPPSRYGCPVFFQNGGSAIHSSDVECHFVFNPWYSQIQ